MILGVVFIFGFLLLAMAGADNEMPAYWVGLFALLACIVSYIAGEDSL